MLLSFENVEIKKTIRVPEPVELTLVGRGKIVNIPNTGKCC